jgi:methylenetetrahydrofolate--tRNA-(uracil-5-)-methyltransferase
MKANMGLLPPLQDRVRNKRQRYAAYADRARQELEQCLEQLEFSPVN